MRTGRLCSDCAQGEPPKKIDDDIYALYLEGTRRELDGACVEALFLTTDEARPVLDDGDRSSANVSRSTTMQSPASEPAGLRPGRTIGYARVARNILFARPFLRPAADA